MMPSTPLGRRPKLDSWWTPGNAYKEMGQMEQAYDCYLDAYNVQKDAGVANRELRRIVDLMIDVTPAGSDRRQQLMNLRGQL